MRVSGRKWRCCKQALKVAGWGVVGSDPCGWASCEGSLGQPSPLMVLPHGVWEDEEMLLLPSWRQDLAAWCGSGGWEGFGRGPLPFNSFARKTRVVWVCWLGFSFSLELWPKSPRAGMCPLPGAEGVGGGKQENTAILSHKLHIQGDDLSSQSHALGALGMNRNTKWDLGRGCKEKCRLCVWSGWRSVIDVLAVPGAAEDAASGIHTGSLAQEFLSIPCWISCLLSTPPVELEQRHEMWKIGCAGKSQTQGLFKVQWDTLQEEWLKPCRVQLPKNGNTLLCFRPVFGFFKNFFELLFSQMWKLKLLWPLLQGHCPGSAPPLCFSSGHLGNEKF